MERAAEMLRAQGLAQRIDLAASLGHSVLAWTTTSCVVADGTGNGTASAVTCSIAFRR